ncbi:head GIN domain-containing protein [Sphingomonas sp. Sphisp140]|uniref:head GIN domain-containing protein n=1 Tax=unclassified Sphingomonas TaxID=196159 RepID=UPI0039AED019
MRSLIALALLPLMATGACHASWEKDGGKDGHEVKQSGVTAKRSYDATGFTKVELRGTDDVDVKNGAQFAVTAEGDSAILDQLEIQVVDGTLRIGRKDRRGFSWGHSDQSVKVSVTLPKLVGATLTGTGDISVDKAEGDFHGKITGTGDLKIAALAATDADLSITGTGNLTVTGTANRLNASITGPGDIDASKFTASSASISILGPGSLKGNVTGGASISIAGPGDVDLTGGAKCSISATGPGEAHCS